MKSPNTKDSKDQGIQIRLKTRAVLLGVAALFSIIGSLGSDSDMTSSKNHNQAIEQCDNNKIVNQSENKNLKLFANRVAFLILLLIFASCKPFINRL